MHIYLFTYWHGSKYKRKVIGMWYAGDYSNNKSPFCKNINLSRKSVHPYGTVNTDDFSGAKRAWDRTY